jgi:hypothetical protein
MSSRSSGYSSRIRPSMLTRMIKDKAEFEPDRHTSQFVGLGAEYGHRRAVNPRGRQQDSSRESRCRHLGMLKRRQINTARRARPTRLRRRGRTWTTDRQRRVDGRRLGAAWVDATAFLVRTVHRSSPPGPGQAQSRVQILSLLETCWPAGPQVLARMASAFSLRDAPLLERSI